MKTSLVSDRDGDDNIYVMNRDGSHVRRLTTSHDSDWSPRWAPDGTTLLFISGSFDTDRWSLFSVSVDGTASPEVVVEGVDSGNAAWYVAGDRIIFGRYVDEESRLFTALSDGSDVRPSGSD